MSSILIEYHWARPTPQDVSRQLIRLAGELEDLREPMMVAGELARVDIQERFDTATSPDGVMWAPWAESYEPWASENTTGPIFSGSANLHLTGALKDSLNSRSAFVGTDQGLFLDTGGLPEYWAWNNFGAERTNPTAGKGAGTIRRYNKSLRENSIFGDTDFGALSGENPLPARPFAGITDKAQIKMDAAFYAWFEGEVAFATSSLGKPFFRHAKREGSGKFPTRFAPL